MYAGFSSDPPHLAINFLKHEGKKQLQVRNCRVHTCCRVLLSFFIRKATGVPFSVQADVVADATPLGTNMPRRLDSIEIIVVRRWGGGGDGGAMT